MKWIIFFSLLIATLFCVFGFLATFEPGAENAMVFRAVYALGGTVCLLGSGRAILKQGR